MATINFKKVPVKNPNKEPSAALTAVFESVLFINSPTKAPINGHIIMPKGPKTGNTIATTKPIVVPITPNLLPPNRIV